MDTHEKEERDDMPGETNFSTRESFELDDLLENNGAKLEAIPVDMLRTEDTGDILPDLQHLTEPTRSRVLQILKEFKDLFKTVVSSKGASVTPFELKVDKSGWHLAKNHGRPRRVSRTSEIEFKRQIESLLELGVIRPSRAGYYSHGFMVPKPGGKMRLVIDFKGLNMVSQMESGWGIPNIKDILERLGEQKSGFFCKLYLTDVFHQMLIR
jgi:hypothetical protein